MQGSDHLDSLIMATGIIATARVAAGSSLTSPNSVSRVRSRSGSAILAELVMGSLVWLCIGFAFLPGKKTSQKKANANGYLEESD